MLSRLRKALHSVGLVHDDLPPLTPEEAALWQVRERREERQAHLCSAFLWLVVCNAAAARAAR